MIKVTGLLLEETFKSLTSHKKSKIDQSYFSLDIIIHKEKNIKGQDFC